MITINGTYGNNGNLKLGKGVSLTNRQAGTTCPGASEWCALNCYAKHGRYQQFGLQTKYGACTLELPARPRSVFRWNVSGDFDTVDAVNYAIEYMAAHPETKFWAYTRSWNVPALLPALERMRQLPNMQLFGSTDPSMPKPPDSWRVAYLEIDDRFKGMECLEQAHTIACESPCKAKTHVGKMPDCKTCGYCFKKEKGSVQFNIH